MTGPTMSPPADFGYSISETPPPSSVIETLIRGSAVALAFGLHFAPAQRAITRRASCAVAEGFFHDTPMTGFSVSSEFPATSAISSPPGPVTTSAAKSAVFTPYHG